MARVTYIPSEGDPLKTKFNGFVFKAHEPRDIPDNAVIRLDDGKTRPMMDAIRGNPFFEIEGEKRPGKGAPPAVPRTTEEYRAYAVKWINHFDDEDGFDAYSKRWEKEQPLREQCGIGDEDMSFIMQFYSPKYDRLKRANMLMA